MSAPQWTPGPWSHGAPAWFRGRSNPEDGKRPITAGDSPVIGNVYGAANARLIASAPDLVEALLLIRAKVAMMQDMSRSELEAVRDQHAAQWADQLTAALSKAGAFQ